jgi:hypothetical protein
VADVFRRPRLAAELASRLLRPGVLDEGLRSGLFLSGLRRTGKTTFLRTDLVPELEDQGALVIYVDLWSDTKASPAALVQAAVRQTLGQLATPSSPLLARLRRIRGLDLGGMGFRFGFQLGQQGCDQPQVRHSRPLSVSEPGSSLMIGSGFVCGQAGVGFAGASWRLRRLSPVNSMR